jgi:hypothetical protein
MFVSKKKHHIAAYETNIRGCTSGPTAPGPQEGMTFVSNKKHHIAAYETNIPRATLPAPSSPPVSTGFSFQPCVSTRGGHADALGPQEGMTFVSKKKHHIAAYETNIRRCTSGPTAPGPQEGMTFVSNKRHHIAAYETNIPRRPAFSCSASGAMRNTGRRARPRPGPDPGALLKAARAVGTVAQPAPIRHALVYRT